MALFRLGSFKSASRRSWSDHSEQQSSLPPFSSSPSQLQMSLDQSFNGSVAFSTGGARGSGKSSPLRGHCVKEYEEKLAKFEHENFNLKLRVFLLEEHMSKALGKDNAAELVKENIELTVSNEALRKEMEDKQQLLTQASAAIERLEKQQSLAQKHFEAEKASWEARMQDLQAQLEDVMAQARATNAGLHLPPSEASLALYQQAFNASSLAASSACGCEHEHEALELKKRLANVENQLEQLREEAMQQLVELESSKTETKNALEELDRQRDKLQALSVELHEKVQVLDAQQERLLTLETELAEKAEKCQELEQEVAEKEAKMDCLMQDMETKHVEIKDKDKRIQTLRDDLSAKEPEIEIKVQEISEKDKIIQEKQCQLEQQNKILVEIQITLDEKQKQIEELESALSERKKRVEVLESTLAAAKRTIKGLVEDAQKHEKEKEGLCNDVKKRDKRIRDLSAELKEVKEMLNKAQWEAETSGREDNVKAMAEEENERLWTELEEKNKQLAAFEKEREAWKKDAEQMQRLITECTARQEALSLCEQRATGLTASLADVRQQLGLKEQRLAECERDLHALRTQSQATPSVSSPHAGTDIILQLQQAQPLSPSHKVLRKKKPRSPELSASRKSVANSEEDDDEHEEIASPEDCKATSGVELPTPLLVAETCITNGNTTAAVLQPLVTSSSEARNQSSTDVSLKEMLDSKEKLVDTLMKQVKDKEEEIVRLQQLLTSNLSSALNLTPTKRKSQSQKLEHSGEKMATECEVKKPLSETPSEALLSKLRVESLEESHRDEIKKLKDENANWKQKCDKFLQTSLDHHKRDSSLKYKREITKLRKRLADSTNACDMLRMRLEELADFLEEVLHLDENGVLNLNRMTPQLRQAIEHSISQSRELSRSLSQSLMIGVDATQAENEEGEGEEGETSSISSWSLSELGDESSRIVTQNGGKVEDLMFLRQELDMQSKVREEQASMIQCLQSEMRILREKAQEANNETLESVAYRPSLAVGDNMTSTPFVGKNVEYGQGRNNALMPVPFQASFLSPEMTPALDMHVTRRDRSSGSQRQMTQQQQQNQTWASVNTGSRNTTLRTRSDVVLASETEAWSEPDRSVSFARMGLQSNVSPTLSGVNSRSPHGRNAHSRCSGGGGGAGGGVTVKNGSQSDESSDETKQPLRRVKSDASELKRVQHKLREAELELEQYRAERIQLQAGLLNVGDANETNSSVLVLDALQSRVSKLKDSLKRKEQRLVEAKDAQAQLEFKWKEQGFRVKELELTVKGLEDKLAHKEKEGHDCQEKLKQSEAMLLRLKSDLEANGTELERREMSLKQLGWNIKDLETQLAAELKASQAKDVQMTSLQAQWAEQLGKLEKLENEMTSMRQSKAVLEEENLKIRQECQLLKAVAPPPCPQCSKAVNNALNHFGKDSNNKENLEQTNVGVQTMFVPSPAARREPLAEKQTFPSIKLPIGENIPNASYGGSSSGGKASEELNVAGTAEVRPGPSSGGYMSDVYLMSSGSPSRPSPLSPTSGTETDMEPVHITGFNLHVGPREDCHLSPDLGIESSESSRLPSLEAALPETNPAGTEKKHLTLNVTERCSQRSAKSTPVLLTPGCPTCPLLLQKYNKAKALLQTTTTRLREAHKQQDHIKHAVGQELTRTRQVLKAAGGLLQLTCEREEARP